MVWSVDSQGYVDNSAPIYLSVEIYPTNFEVLANQYATVKVNGNAVAAHCTPDESCGTEWYSCVSELDVSSYRSEPLGGLLTVEVSVTGVNSGVCDYLDHPLYTRMFLRETLPTGEPTTMPSSWPTGEPTGIPTAQPSTKPTGIPSSEPTTNPSGYPTSEPSREPSSQPSCQPSSDPSGIPSSEPSSQPSIIPSALPSGQPSDCPTGVPSGQPTTQPTRQPSEQPTSHPTMIYPQNLLFTGGGDESSPVMWNVDSLAYVDNSYPLYLTVELIPTNYEVFANQYATVKVNGYTVDAHCSPDESCDSEWFTCFTELDVSSYRVEPLGGSLTIEVSVTGVKSGACDYLGYPLYTRMQLREALPTGQPTTIPSGVPTDQPSCIPSSIPTSIPTVVPTSQPTSQPTGKPTSQPTSIPSGQPTSVPSSFPTLGFPLTEEAELGGMHNVTFVLSELGFVNRSNPKYLSVSVWPTNYDDKASEWATVKINDRVVVEYCTPQQSCGERFYFCIFQENIANYVNSTLGGSITVEVLTTGVNSGPCDYQGFPLYARVHLTEITPTEQNHFSVWIIIAACIGFFILLVILSWMWFSRNVKRSQQTYMVENKDVELGQSREDVIGENEEMPIDSKIRAKPVADEVYRRKHKKSKLVPVEETDGFNFSRPTPSPSPMKVKPKPTERDASFSGNDNIVSGPPVHLCNSPTLKKEGSQMSILLDASGKSLSIVANELE